MTFDDGLAARIRSQLGNKKGPTERNGHLRVAVLR
jgi:hypothetical protein